MIGFALYGAAQLAAFLETAKGQRSPWTLIGGLTLIAFAAVALWAAFFTPGGAALLIASLTNFVAFFTVIQGVSQLILFDEMRRSRLPGAGWMLAGGILNAVAGNLLVMQPLTGWLAVSTIWGHLPHRHRAGAGSGFPLQPPGPLYRRLTRHPKKSLPPERKALFAVIRRWGRVLPR